MADELKDLMQVYSQRGLSEWTRDAQHGVRSAVGDCLPNVIVENDWEISQVISGRAQKFIPMPRHGYKKRLEWCFFWPKNVGRRSGALTVLMLVNRANRHCVACRFESDFRGAHGYTHVQFTAKWGNGGEALPHVPQWLPASYPAFPIPAQNWTELFLVMATAVHGYCGGVDVVLRELFQAAAPAERAQRYMDVLAERLVSLEPGR